ncbi:MAG: hypothetical protein HRT58_10645 [Crocinitomicaceae bacterium]|nr:hypothetical protein [Flavobacteriales bacterium]NQZ36112.1 hypothetical protein [Crocinitomicaceae bacterium]
MILLAILICALLQSAILFLCRKSKTVIVQVIVTAIFLYLNFKIIPPYFLPEPNLDGVNCGLPIIGVYGVFWIFGLISTITVTMIFLCLRVKEQRPK